MVRITFEPFEELTSEDWDRIIEFIGVFGGEIDTEESEEKE